MKKKFEPLAVSIDSQDGTIRIEQDYGMDDPAVIVITPEQIPQLVALLREAEAACEERAKDKPSG